MSYRAIAAALALEDLSVGQRLTAFSLASFANRQHRAWPSAGTAAARAGLSRRQYLSARAELECRGLITREGDGPRSTLVALTFAEQGASVEREINAQLFEATLARSRSRGGARVLLAVLAALAADDGTVDGLSVEEISEAGGLSDSTYRRARAQLLASEEIELDEQGGGRSRCNRWRLIAAAAAQMPSGLDAAMLIPTLAAEEDLSSGRSENPVTNPVVNPGQNRTPSHQETPSQTPPETPSSRAGTGREPQNQRTTPPDPPEGGHPDRVVIVEDFVSSRGRHRQRQVTAVPAAELSPIRPADHDAWNACRELLRQAVGNSTFQIWMADLELIAVSRRDQALLITGRPETALWVSRRYGRLLASLADHCGRPVRVADERERQLYVAAGAIPSPSSQRTVSRSPRPDQQEVV